MKYKKKKMYTPGMIVGTTGVLVVVIFWEYNISTVCVCVLKNKNREKSVVNEFPRENNFYFNWRKDGNFFKKKKKP